MEQKDKQPPSIAPEDDSFSKNLALAIKDENIRRPFTVTMKIRGGIPSQGYILDFSASGDGTAECSFQCSLSDREGASQKANLDTKDLIELLRSLMAPICDAFTLRPIRSRPKGRGRCRPRNCSKWSTQSALWGRS